MLIALVLLAGAAVPDDVVVSGRLARDGAPVNGTVAAVFNIFDDPDAGAAVGASIVVAALDVTDGVFVAELSGLVDLVDGRPLFVEVTLDGETLSPRLALATVPYAAMAGTVEFSDILGVPPELLDGDQVAIQAGSLVAISPLEIAGTNLSVRQNSIIGDLLQDGAVRNEKITNGAVTSNKLAADAVRSEHIASNAVGVDEIAGNAVGSDELQDGAVTTREIQDNSVGRNDIGSQAVASDEIEDGTILTADLANSAVTSSRIQDGAVTSAKIVADAIGRAQLAGGEVDVFSVDNANCEGTGSLSLLATCRSRVCGIDSGALRFLSCGGTCNQTEPQSCNNGPRAGRLLSPSAP